MTIAQRLITSDLTARIAEGRQELLAAFALVYRWYLAKGFVRPHAAGVVYRDSFGLDGSRTFVARRRTGALVGTLTLVGDSPLGFDMERTYGREIAALRGAGLRLAEITALAAEPAADLPVRGIFLSLARLMFQYADFHGFDKLAMVVHPHHESFYRRLFGAERLGPARRHAPACDRPGVGLAIDVAGAKRFVHADLLDWFVLRRLSPEELCRPPISAEDKLFFQLLMRYGRPPEIVSDSQTRAGRAA